MTAKRPNLINLDTASIRAAVCGNRGGYHGAPDSDILSVWEQLTAEQRTKYLDSAGIKSAPPAPPAAAPVAPAATTEGTQTDDQPERKSNADADTDGTPKRKRKGKRSKK